ncbi:MAG: TetR/AcrR family transcriptional regulator [Candidatus Bipolaricaulota bacterium]
MAKTSRTRRRDRQATERRIFEAAAAEFSDRGYSGATLARIAGRAASSKALVVRYFGSKQELYRSVLNTKYADLSSRETVRATSSAGSVRKLLEDILADLFAFNAENPEFSRLVAWENLNGAKHLDPDRAREAREPGWSRLRRVIEAAQRAGEIRPDLDVERFVYALQALTVVYFSNRYTMKILTGIPFDDPDTMEGFVAFYADLLARGIGTQEGKDG